MMNPITTSCFFAAAVGINTSLFCMHVLRGQACCFMAARECSCTCRLMMSAGSSLKPSNDTRSLGPLSPYLFTYMGASGISTNKHLLWHLMLKAKLLMLSVSVAHQRMHRLLSEAAKSRLLSQTAISLEIFQRMSHACCC